MPGVLTVRADHPDAVHAERVTPWLLRWCGSRGARVHTGSFVNYSSRSRRSQ